MNSDELAALLENPGEDPYGVDLHRLCAVLLTYQQSKEVGYGGSWARRGEVGVYMNLMRKSDRLETLVPLVLSGECDGMALVDTLADLINYGMMWISYIGAARPNDLEKWIRDVFCKETGADPEMVTTIIFSVDR